MWGHGTSSMLCDSGDYVPIILYDGSELRGSALYHSGDCHLPNKNLRVLSSGQAAGVTRGNSGFQDASSRERHQTSANIDLTGEITSCQRHGTSRPVNRSPRHRGQFRSSLAARHHRQERRIVSLYRWRAEDPRLDVRTGETHWRQSAVHSVGCRYL
jgi:hypothetical protein